MNPYPMLRILAAVVLFSLGAAVVAKADQPPREGLQSLTVHPSTVVLQGPRSRQRLIVIGKYAEGVVRDLSPFAEFSVSDPAILSLRQNQIGAKANGAATVSVRFGDHQAEVNLKISGVDESAPISMAYEAVPALTRLGCNAGICHGSPTGKGGFRLSLRGFDADLDQTTLCRESSGRRTNFLDPDNSLLLLKPRMKLSHGGGLKLTADDPALAILRDWIAQGCRPEPTSSPSCDRIEVFPPERTFRGTDSRQTMVVLAYFSNGEVRDVTELTSLTSTSEQIATVDRQGRITAKDRGESVILAKFLHHVRPLPVTVLRQPEGFAWPDPAENNYIDTLIFKKLRRLHLPPSPLCTDGEFIRRATLDVLGRLPTAEEAAHFLSDASATKRETLVDRLLADPAFPQYWAHQWADLLQVSTAKLTAQGAKRFHQWLLKAAQANMPYDQFASELLTASGGTYDNPAANYYRASPDANSRAENTAQLFLGARMQCARCHNHPYERWTQNDYYGLAAFFARVQQKPLENSGEMLVFLAEEGEVTHPHTEQHAPLQLPGGAAIDSVEDSDRREALARWLTNPQNPFFAQVGANRIWGRLLGRGLVEPVDDFRASNPPSHPALLEALAKDFVDSGYDQRRLLRTILRSRVYQLSSQSTSLNAPDEKYFSHATARMLTAEQLLDAISDVTGAPERFRGAPSGTRAMELASPPGEHDFLKTFGQPERKTVCECERADDPKLSGALSLINGQFILQKLRSPGSRLMHSFDDVPARLKAAGEPPQNGRLLWLDAAAGVLSPEQTPAEQGQPVSLWQDRSGKKLAAAQSEPKQRPTYIAAAIAGLPAIRFDGQDDLLSNASDELLPSGAPRTLIVVGRAGADGGALFAFRRSSAGGKPVFVAQHGAHGGRYYVYTDGLNGGGNTTLPPTTLAAVQEPFITTFTSSGAGSKLQLTLNGASQPVAQPGAIGPDEGTPGFTVGNREDVRVDMFPWDGDLAEVLVYDHPLTEEETAQVGSYLTTKYQLHAEYPQRTVDQPARGPEEDRRLIRELYLSAFARPPSIAEQAVAEDYLAQSKDKQAGLEDLFWAVMNSKEFLFQH